MKFISKGYRVSQMTLTRIHVLQSEDKDSGYSVFSQTHTQKQIHMFYMCALYVMYNICTYLYQKNGGLLKYMCLSSVSLYKIIRNGPIFVRSSEEKAIMFLCSTFRNLAATPVHLKSIRVGSFQSFIWTLAIPRCPPS